MSSGIFTDGKLTAVWESGIATRIKQLSQLTDIELEEVLHDDMIGNWGTLPVVNGVGMLSPPYSLYDAIVAGGREAVISAIIGIESRS